MAKNKFNPDWLIEELQIQMAVLEMTDEKKKVYDIIRAIEILKKDLNVFYFPAVMNFVSIERPVPQPFQVPPLPPPSGIPYHMGGQVLFNPNTHGISPNGIPSVAPAHVVTGNSTTAPMVPAFGGSNYQPVQCVPAHAPAYPCPPVSVSPYPISHHHSWNSDPKPGDRIFGLFKDENGNICFCIYTWQEEDNPEEIFSYSVGSSEFYPAGRRYMPCKKVTHEKFMVICTSECCNQE